MSKSLVFFSGGSVVEAPSPIFQHPETKKRGRRSHADAYFPNGMAKPSREAILDFVLNHVLYQIDPSIGPIFCKHVIKPNRERNRESMYHLVLGPHEWCGVWEIVGNRRMLDLRAVYVEHTRSWLPQMILSPGNYIGVDNLNGIELSREQLRRAIIKRGFIDAETYDRYASPSLTVRYNAIAGATPGIWM